MPVGGVAREKCGRLSFDVEHSEGTVHESECIYKVFIFYIFKISINLDNIHFSVVSSQVK